MDLKKYAEIELDKIVKQLEADYNETKEKEKHESGKNNQYAAAWLNGRAKGLRTALDLLEGVR